MDAWAVAAMEPVISRSQVSAVLAKYQWNGEMNRGEKKEGKEGTGEGGK
jgi:hypothetical protein